MVRCCVMLFSCFQTCLLIMYSYKISVRLIIYGYKISVRQALDLTWFTATDNVSPHSFIVHIRALSVAEALSDSIRSSSYCGQFLKMVSQ